MALQTSPGRRLARESVRRRADAGLHRHDMRRWAFGCAGALLRKVKSCNRKPEQQADQPRNEFRKYCRENLPAAPFLPVWNVAPRFRERVSHFAKGKWFCESPPVKFAFCRWRRSRRLLKMFRVGL